jgi:uncharacterized protein with NRDE domain
MCLLVIAWRVHPRYRLLLAANRDEFHDRPALPLARWDAPPDVVGGRDVQAGGTWLAVDTEHRLGVVTNYRELARQRRSAPSRGGLIPAYLGSATAPKSFLDSIELDAAGYAGFNLLLADRESLWYASNRADRFARELEPGLYGLSNHALDTPWPKLVKVRERFADLLAADTVDTAALLTMLADREPAAVDSQPPTGLPPDWERALSSPFVNHQNYGTRCSTIVSVTHAGQAHVFERRFDRSGQPAGEIGIDL